MSAAAEALARDRPAPATWPPLLRSVVFLATLMLAWVSLHAFESLGTPASLDLSNGKDGLTYLSLLVLTSAAILLLGDKRFAVLHAFTRMPMLALLGWLLVTSVASDDPSTSLRRFLMTGLVMVVAAAMPLLVAGRVQFARQLAVAMAIVLVLSYAGVVLVPDLAVHQATDVGEPMLAGDWRGVFAHKNEAAGTLSLFVFFGLFVARSGLVLPGLGLAGAALVFMLFAGGKTALGLVGLTIAIVAIWRRCAPGPLRTLVLLGPLAVLNLFGVGTVLFPPLGRLIGVLPIDTTFTRRTDVWAFAIDKLSGRWLFGHGFEAFWNTAATRFGNEDQDWAATASHAHNAYLDAVVNSGLPGLALLLAAFLVAPLRDVAAAERRGADPALLAALQQVWLFCLYLGAMETIFFDRSGPVWITFLIALFGLHYAARYGLRRGDPA